MEVIRRVPTVVAEQPRLARAHPLFGSCKFSIRRIDTAGPGLGQEVTDRPVYPWDLIGSMYQQLGIPTDATLPHPQGLEIPVVPSAVDGMPSGGLLKEIT